MEAPPVTGDSFADVELKPMKCPTCGKPMHFYGGTAGYICCENKVLIRADGWFDDNGLHVADDRLAGGDRTRSVTGLIERAT